ncbi:zinc ribbon domain-containing protein [Anaerolineales bacterium HSG24]|nr:zinc ribbon domain-containing protein [Anaerolineales bacterium HSG24]
MIKRYNVSLKYYLLTLFLVALFWLPSAYAATPQIKNLEIKIWPEYDQPETLIIYAGEISEDTELPVTLTFLLPNYIDDLHAIAYVEDEQLFRVPANNVELNPDNQYLSLSFSIPSRMFQFEYYDPHILTKDGDQRQLDYLFQASLDTKLVNFELQQPKQSTDFSITPSAQQNLTNSDGITYYQLEQTDMKQGDNFDINVTYIRPTDQSSVQLMSNAPPTPVAQTEVAPPVVTPASTQTSLIGYILIIGGVVLLGASGGYWYWSHQQTAATSGKGRRRSQQSGKSASFCHKCGTKLRNEAEFCHNCGAPCRP